MTEQSMFWYGTTGGGAPGDAGGYSDDQFAEFVKAVFELRTGVIDGLAVVASSPNAKSVDAEAGRAIIRGRTYVNDAAKTLTIADNSSGNPRIDRIVLRVDWAAQTIRLAVLQGTPAASPTPPALTQNDGVLWEESLAQVNVADGFVSIADGDITRERVWARTHEPGALKFTANANLESAGDWLLADGRAVSRTTYRDLFDATGTAFGVGDGSTTFNIPDLRGRFPLGMDDMGTAQGAANRVTDPNADILGGTGGSETHTQTVGELAAHSHVERVRYSSGSITVPELGSGATSQASSVSTSSTGSSDPMDIMNPWEAGYWYVRV